MDDSDIEMKEILHNGGQARIYLARSKSLNQDVIVKELINGDFNKELRVKGMDHENIVKFFGNLSQKPHHLIYEYVWKGDLESIILSDYDLLKESPLKHMEGILRGMEYIHDNHIVHLDLHSKNILVHMTCEGELIMKICDFGLSEKQNGGIFSQAVMGRPGYVSPEKTQCGAINTNSDIWSFAAIMWKFFTAKEAYGFENEMTAYYIIGKNQHPDVPSNWPVLVQKLFFHCWDSRKNATELLNLFSNNRIKRDTERRLFTDMPLTFYHLFVESHPERVVASIEWDNVDKNEVFQKHSLPPKEFNSIKNRFKGYICTRKFAKIQTSLDLLVYLNEHGHFQNLDQLDRLCIGELYVKKNKLIRRASQTELVRFARVLGMPDDDIDCFKNAKTVEFVNEIYDFWSDSSLTMDSSPEFDSKTFNTIAKQTGIDYT